MDYGRDYDFSKPFFQQYSELINTVPYPALAVLKPSLENSDYCNQVGYVKNCYLIFDSRRSEQCLYGKTVERCFDCVDCYKVFDCSTCYECNTCVNTQFSTYLLNCHTCADCHYSSELIGCKYCFGCCNLKNKQYCFFNEQLTEEDWHAKVKKFRAENSPEELQQKLHDHRKKYPKKAKQEFNTEDCTGDYLVECFNCEDCYDCEYLQDGRYCYDFKKDDSPSSNVFDFTYFGGNVEYCCECVNSGYALSNLFVCDNIWTCNDVFYSRFCQNSNHLFGCAGMHQKEYCIFNKQYTEEEYNELVPRIIEHMQENNDWGEFFPTAISPFAYNETVAEEFFPMTKEEILVKGWRWNDQIDPRPDVEKTIEANRLPPNIHDIPDDILNWSIICTSTDRPFRIIAQELEFYRKLDLPIPHNHPDERHRLRLLQRNPRHLWNRTCAKCQKPIETSYQPDHKEIGV